MSDETTETSLGDDIATAMGGSTSTSEPSSDATSTGDPSAPPGAATTAPAQGLPETPSTDPQAKQGPIPFAVHTTALDNARLKAVAEFKQQYAGVDRYSPEQWQQISAYIDHAQRDPGGFLVSELTESANPIEVLQQAIEKLQAHPEHGRALKSLAARALSQHSQQAAEDQEPQADFVYQTEQGPVPFYSADQQAKREAFLQRQWEARVDEKLQPFQKSHDALQAREQAVAEQQAIDHFVTTTHQDVMTWQGMDTKENQEAVALRLAQTPIRSDDPREVSLALNAAYRAVVLPNLQRTATQAVLTNHQLKANANTVNPNQTTTGTPKSASDMSWRELFQSELAARRG